MPKRDPKTTLVKAINNSDTNNFVNISANAENESAVPATQIGGDDSPASANTKSDIVRPARAADLSELSYVQATSMLLSLQAAYKAAHNHSNLPANISALINPDAIRQAWQQVIEEPPSAAHHLLVATATAQLAGFIALAPTTIETAPNNAAAASGAPIPQSAAEITALGVIPSQQRHGHGSRLLAAASHYARSDGAKFLLVWAVCGDESLSSLLSKAGFARTPATRQLPIGSGIAEACWVTAL